MGNMLGTTQKNVMQKIVTQSALIIIDDDLVTTYVNPDCEFSDESAEANFDAMYETIKDRKVYHLVVPDPTSHVTVEARNYINPRFEELKKGEALVIKTLGHRMLAQFYMMARKDKDYPIRIFDNEKAASEWFDSLRLMN